MRVLGMVLLTGAAAVVAWKVLAVLLFGLMEILVKVGLVILVGYMVLKIFNGGKKDRKARA